MVILFWTQISFFFRMHTALVLYLTCCSLQPAGSSLQNLFWVNKTIKVKPRQGYVLLLFRLVVDLILVLSEETGQDSRGRFLASHGGQSGRRCCFGGRLRRRRRWRGRRRCRRSHAWEEILVQWLSDIVSCDKMDSTFNSEFLLYFLSMSTIWNHLNIDLGLNLNTYQVTYYLAEQEMSARTVRKGVAGVAEAYPRESGPTTRNLKEGEWVYKSRCNWNFALHK